VQRERERFILRKQLTQFWRLTNLKSAGQAGRLVMHRMADVAILSVMAIWRQNSFCLRESQTFLIWPSPECMRLTHLMETNLLYSKSIVLNVDCI
jgi:hypothetical protein